MALRKQRRLSFVLEIAGLTIRYFAGVRPPTTPLNGVETDLGSAANYTDVQGITGLTALVEELRPFEGFVRHDPITVTLASNSPKPRSSNDPAIVFGRGRPEAASASAAITVTVGMSASVEPGSPQDIYINDDLSGLSFPRVIQIGREALIATSAGGSQPDPLVADPYYVRVEERGAYPNQAGGVLDTRQQAHTVVVGGIPPVVTTPEITVWQRRRAVLWVAEVSPRGEIIRGYEDVFVGFIAEEPDLSKLGSVQLNLSPLTALLDSDASLARTSTTLLDGVHEWQTIALGGVGDPVPVGHTFEHIQVGLWGDLYITQATAAGDNVLQRIDVVETGSHGVVFDPENLADGHPRVGYITTQRGPILRPTAYVDGDTFEVDDNASQIINADAIGNAPASETHTAEVDYDDSTQIDYQWPQSLGEFCLSDWIYLSTQGAGGAWMAVDPFSADGYYARPAVDPADWGSRTAQIVDIRPKTWSRAPAQQEAEVARVPPVAQWPLEFGSDPGRTPVQSRCWYPYIITGEGVVRGEWTNRVELYTRIPVNSDGVRVEVSFADSWYQTGEPAALVAEPLDLTYSSTVRVEFYEPTYAGGAWQITRREFDAEVTGISSVVLSSTGQTAYRLAWQDPDSVPSFGNWSSFDGSRPCRISAIPDALNRVHPRTLLRAYLLSPLGLGLGAGDVDLASIDRIEVPASLSSLTLPSRLGEQPKIKDLISGIMVASLSAMSMVRGRDGRLRLGVTNIGREQLFDITGSIAQGDWSVAEPPLSDWDQTTANVLEWSMLADDQGKPDPIGTFTYSFDTLIDRYGVQRVKAEVRDIAGTGNRGIVADLAGDLGAASYEIALLYGRPRRLWTGGVGVHLGHEAYVGSTWLVTSDRLQGTISGYGVSDLAGRVIRREIDYWQESCSIEISHHGQEGSGWNWSMDVESKTSTTQFVVGLTTNSQLGDTDTRLFVAGQDVRIVPEYDEDSAVVREIVSVTDDEGNGTSTVVVNAAWAGALPARIEPMTYDDDSALVFRPYAYVADAAGTLGAAGVPSPKIG